MFIKILYANICSIEAFDINFIILITNESTRLTAKHLYCSYLAWMDTL